MYRRELGYNPDKQSLTIATEGNMEEQKKCVYGHPMTAAEWKNQWVCHRCGRTKILHESEFEHRLNMRALFIKLCWT